MAFFERRLSLFVAAVVGAGLFAAVRLVAAVEAHPLIVWAATFAVTIALVAAAGLYVGRHGGSWRRALRLIGPALFLVGSAFPFLLIIETAAGRYALAVAAMLLVGTYFENLRRADISPERPEPVSLLHLAYVVDVIALFCLLGFVFGIASFYYVSMPLLAVAVGAVCVLVARRTLARFGFSPTEHYEVIVVSGFIGAEIYVGLSFLPTSHLVNAAVLVVLYGLLLHVVKQILSGAGEFRHYRRQLVLSLLLVALILATAKWA